MIGGDKDVVDRLDPIFSVLAPGAGDISVTPHRLNNAIRGQARAISMPVQSAPGIL